MTCKVYAVEMLMWCNTAGVSQGLGPVLLHESLSLSLSLSLSRSLALALSLSPLSLSLSPFFLSLSLSLSLYLFLSLSPLLPSLTLSSMRVKST